VNDLDMSPHVLRSFDGGLDRQTFGQSNTFDRRNKRKMEDI